MTDADFTRLLTVQVLNVKVIIYIPHIFVSKISNAQCRSVLSTSSAYFDFDIIRMFLVKYMSQIFLYVQASTNKIQENAGMLTEAEIETVESRADVITYTVLAEMEHFQQNRIVDFQVYMQRYLHGQIAFYRQVSCHSIIFATF